MYHASATTALIDALGFISIQWRRRSKCGTIRRCNRNTCFVMKSIIRRFEVFDCNVINTIATINITNKYGRYFMQVFDEVLRGVSYRVVISVVVRVVRVDTKFQSLLKCCK